MIPISRDTRLYHFCSHNAVQKKTHFVLKCPLYKPIRDKFPSTFDNVVLRSLKSFFQLDQQVNISMYPTETSALRQSKELAGWKPSWCTFKPTSLFIFPDFRINFISLHATAWNDMMAKLSPIHRLCWLLISMSSRCWVSWWVSWGRWAQCEIMGPFMGGTRSGEFGIMNFLKSYRWDTQANWSVQIRKTSFLPKTMKTLWSWVTHELKGKIKLCSVYTSQH